MSQTKSRTFHNLTAGSTAIMQVGTSAKVIRFGGRIEQREGGTYVGSGTYVTSDEKEIEFLVGLCKQPTPQVWEEVSPESAEVPAQVAAAVPAEREKVATELNESAARSTNPALTAAIAKLSKGGEAAVAGNVQNAGSNSSTGA